MNSLEKKMFFLPNRMYVRRNKLLVSFNIAAIPVDMEVTAAGIHLPLPEITERAVLYAKEIRESWSEEGIKKGIVPVRSRRWFKRLPCAPGQAEAVIDVIAFQRKWRFKKRMNHGIFFFLKSKSAISFSEEKPPFMVVDTI